MNFLWSTLNVKNLDESIDFYSNLLNCEVSQRFNVNENMEIAFLGNGETKIELIYNKLKENIVIGNDISWGFSVDSLEKIIEIIKEKNIEMISNIIQPNPNTRFIFIKDPNGMNIQLVEKVIK